MLSVKVGTTVRWTNHEKPPTHSVLFSDAGGFDEHHRPERLQFEPVGFEMLKAAPALRRPPWSTMLMVLSPAPEILVGPLPLASA